MRQSDLRGAELAILNAPFERDGWRIALDAVTAATGATGANLVGFGGPLALSINLFVGRNDARAADYFARPELWGQCNWRVNSAGKPLSIQHDRDYAAYRGANDTSDYDDAVSDLDMPYGCQSPLIVDSRTFLGIALFRGGREGPCSPEMLDRFSTLIRHIHRSVRVELALQGEAADLMIEDAATLSAATILIDRHGCVCALTPAAEVLAGDEGPFRLCGPMIRLRDPHENGQFQGALARLLSIESELRGSRLFEMRIGRSLRNPRGRWGAHIVRLPHRDHGLGFQPHVAVTLQPVAAAA